MFFYIKKEKEAKIVRFNQGKTTLNGRKIIGKAAFCIVSIASINTGS